MPYDAKEDLPISLRTHLPPHAQEIYRAAFNHAFDSDPRERDREARSHRIAWAAVKRSYVKDGARWIRR
ncbi:ChaB family protein [Acuticoccus sp. M5D2P5]|uniref:ChaB family protein n=1 Tax=Acuticoccus kalidii TaxID=2910977 RepID=UPI001F2AD23B|nr:ChaB family protein [Acuticoccus kalidii]MCF3934885.1 ChaB family protein [Acuticoccus kalidii]